MNIVLATDNNFVQHCCVTITSILANNSDVKFYVFTEGLTPVNTELLNRQVRICKGKLEICKIDSSIVGKFPMPFFMSNHISIATYYRLFTADIIPDDIDKVIYLDCDIVVTTSLMKLWDTDITNYALGAIYQSHEHNEYSNCYNRLEIPKEIGYFNAGVLLINLSYWRKNNVQERLLRFIKENHNIIYAHDQDVLNAVLYKETKVLSHTWNFRDCFLSKRIYTYPSNVDYSEILEHPAIIHFVSKPKPWEYECRHPYKMEYFKYLDMSLFKGWRPIFSWRKYFTYTLRPRFRRFIIHIDVLNLRNLRKK